MTTTTVYALEAIADDEPQVVGVFSRPELAKEYAQAVEAEAMREDGEEPDALEWRVGEDFNGERLEWVQADDSYDGTAWRVSMVRLDPPAGR